MWDNYFDKVSYKKRKEELDAAGSKLYESARYINARHVTGGTEQHIDVNGTSVKYHEEYQVPFMVYEGDMIDNREVVYSEPSKDCFGIFHFCIAKVK